MSKNVLPHHAWANKRKYMDFLKAENVNEALHKKLDAYEAKGFIENNGHPTSLASGGLRAAGYTMDRVIAIMGQKTMMWEMALINQLRTFHCQKGTDHAFPMSHTTPAAVMEGMALKIGDLAGAPPAVFMTFEGQDHDMYGEKGARHGGVMLVRSSMPRDPSGPQPDIDNSLPEQEIMKQLSESPLMRQALDISIWPQDIQENWPAAYPAGMNCQIFLDDPSANVMKQIDLQIAEVTQSLEAMASTIGLSYDDIKTTLVNYRDIIAIALNAYRRIPGTQTAPEWQEGIPEYLLKQMDGKNPEAAIRRIKNKGYVKQMRHAPVDIAYDDNLYQQQEDKWRGIIAELDTETGSHGYDIKEVRYVMLSAFINILRQVTNNTGWLHDIWPEQRAILTNSDKYQEALEKYVEKAELEAEMRTDAYYEDIAVLIDIMHPVLTLPMKNYDPLNPWSMTGMPIDDVVGVVAAVRLILTDDAVPLDKDLTIGLILNRALFFEEMMVEARKYERKSPTKPIDVAGGFTISSNGLSTRKTVH